MSNCYIINKTHGDVEIGTICKNKKTKIHDCDRKYVTNNLFNHNYAFSISDKLAKYLLNFNKEQRLMIYETGFYDRINALQRNDKCVALIEGVRQVVKIIDRKETKTEIRFIAETNEKKFHEIRFSNIVEVEDVNAEQNISETSRKPSEINSGQCFCDQTNYLDMTCNSENLENVLIYPRERNRNFCLPVSKYEISLISDDDTEMINSMSSADSSTSSENEHEKVFPDIDININFKSLIPTRQTITNKFGIVPWPRFDKNETEFDEINLNEKDTAIRIDGQLVGISHDQEAYTDSIFADHIIPSLDFIRNVYIANHAIPDNIVIVFDEDYSSNDLVTFMDEIPIHGRIKFAAELQNNRLLGIIIVSDMTNIPNEMSLVLTNKRFDKEINGVIIKRDMASKFNQDLKTFDRCPLIDIASVKTFEKHESDRFQINDIIKYLVDQRYQFGRVIRLVLLNDVPCVELKLLMLDDDDISVTYLSEENANLVDDIQLETRYFDEILIDPFSVVSFENIYVGEWVIDDEIHFYLQGFNKIYKGNLKWIGKINGMNTAAVEMAKAASLDCIIPYRCSDIILNNLLIQTDNVIVMVKTSEIYKDCSLFEQFEIMNKYFLDLLRSAKNSDLESQIILDLVKMKNQRMFVSIFNCDDYSINLENHEELLSYLIQEENYYFIKLVLLKCYSSDQTSQILLHLANIALKIEDEYLFSISIRKCVDKNAFLENGETFLTNLLKENSNEILVNNVINRGLFDRNQMNRFNESPFTIACNNAMLSTMWTLVNNVNILSLHENDADELLVLVQNKLSGKKSADQEYQMEKITYLLDHITIIFTMNCQICQNKQIKIAFGCDHLSCESCNIDLNSCPLCGRQIENFRNILII